MRLLPALLMVLATAICTIACSEDKRETISISADPETFPTMRTTNVSTVISDSGYTRYHITTPLWLMFEEATEPHWNFPEGMFIVKLDNDMKEDGTFTSDTATFFSNKKLWQFDRNVRMRNVDGDRFLTQQLFWDQNAHKVYSDSFIHIERSDRIIEGYGFESNENMTTYTVRRPSAILPTAGFTRARTDGPGAPRADTIQPPQPTATAPTDSIKE
ncbi:MAG: LPS export ABC transporter periplasmic protein LptC [Bacteroidales bacterium]|nr:LPS export ABC transporter periplasmic protein LptC [Bacteroidales bacterium]